MIAHNVIFKLDSILVGNYEIVVGNIHRVWLGGELVNEFVLLENAVKWCLEN